MRLGKSGRITKQDQGGYLRFEVKFKRSPVCTGMGFSPAMFTWATVALRSPGSRNAEQGLHSLYILAGIAKELCKYTLRSKCFSTPVNIASYQTC